MCVLSIKVPIRKKVWKLIVCPSYHYFRHHQRYLVVLCKSKWLQVSSCIQDFSRYSSRPNHAVIRCLDFSSGWSIPPVSFQVFGDYSYCTNYNWYNCHLLVQQVFSSLSRSIYLYMFCFLVFSLDGSLE